MIGNKDVFYFFNWDLICPPTDLVDLTQGDEVIEIYIHEIGGCRPPARYAVPIVQPGRSFAFLPVNLIYQTDKFSNTLKDIFVSIRILRGIEHRLIYMNEFILLAPFYADKSVRRIPIHRVWYYQDYYKVMHARVYS
jgi:hypothetical protein